MGFLKLFIFTSAIAFIFYSVLIKKDADLSTDIGREDGWYGTGKKREDNKAIIDFKLNVPENVLQDLKIRLAKARIDHENLEDSNDFTYGFNANFLRDLQKYWIETYDWRKQEVLINTFHHYKTEIEGMKVHFIRQKAQNASKYKYVVPLLIVHGWPGNVFEFYKVIPILTDPLNHGIQSEIAFEIIAPSIPGYGWSDSPKKTGFSQIECARVFHKLMKRLGYKKFFLQGGDWGSMVTTNMARMYKDSVYGLHLNMVPIMPGTTFLSTAYDVLATIAPKLFISSSALQSSHNMFSKVGKLILESGYMHLQATKPDTIGTALNDSPIGLAAYILEKFSTWTNYEFRNLPDGGLTKRFTKDELLTMIMIYWTNGNILSSQRFYKEFFLDKRNDQLSKVYIEVPTGHSSGLNELFDRTPVEISKLLMNITFYNEIPNMGHFACFEEPVGMAKDIIAFANLNFVN